MVARNNTGATGVRRRGTSRFRGESVNPTTGFTEKQERQEAAKRSSRAAEREEVRANSQEFFVSGTKEKVSPAVADEASGTGAQRPLTLEEQGQVSNFERVVEGQPTIDGGSGNFAQKEAAAFGEGERGAPITEAGRVAQQGFLESQGVLDARPTEENEIAPASLATDEGKAQLEAEVERRTQNLAESLGISISKDEKTVMGALGQEEFNALGISLGKERLARSVLDKAARGIILVEAGAGAALSFVNSVIGNQESVVQDAQSSLEAKKSEVSNIFAEVEAGRLSLRDGFRAVDAVERRSDDEEELIQREIVTSPELRLNPGALSDIQADFLELRQEIFDARRTLGQVVVGETTIGEVSLALQRQRKK